MPRPSKLSIQKAAHEGEAVRSKGPGHRGPQMLTNDNEIKPLENSPQSQKKYVTDPKFLRQSPHLVNL